MSKEGVILEMQEASSLYLQLMSVNVCVSDCMSQQGACIPGYTGSPHQLL